MSISDQFLADAEAPQLPADASLSRVRNLVERQTQLASLIAHLEAELKAAQQDLQQVQEVDLPSALQEYGFSDIRMTDGSRVTIKQEYYATIKEEKKSDAFRWLEHNGHADLIKHDVTLSFTRGQDEYANQAMELLKENNLPFVDKRHVHPQTLRAFVREQIENGKELPLETFSVHVRQVAKIQKEK